MNVVMIVPTGIGCEIGGHGGDANAAARLLARCCDTLIVHPNVVNASDSNEMPANCLYVEGSILDRFLKGQLFLQRVLSNKVLVAAPRLRHDQGMSVAEVGCLVSPYGCFGVPPQACWDAPVPVIAVRENRSCRKHPERKEFIYVDNYLEAAGVLMAMQAGVHPSCVRRPLPQTRVIS